MICTCDKVGLPCRLLKAKTKQKSKVKMYKYNIYFLTKMGDLQNIHTALVSILQISHARDTTKNILKNCMVGVLKIGQIRQFGRIKKHKVNVNLNIKSSSTQLNIRLYEVTCIPDSSLYHLKTV